MTVKSLVTIVALLVIIFLVIAGTIAGNINYTTIALALVTLLGLIWGDPLNRKGGGDS